MEKKATQERDISQEMLDALDLKVGQTAAIYDEKIHRATFFQKRKRTYRLMLVRNKRKGQKVYVEDSDVPFTMTYGGSLVPGDMRGAFEIRHC